MGYNTKAATALGVIHIICGFIALGSGIAGCGESPYIIGFVIGILTFVFFALSGGLAIGGARSGNNCLVLATLVTSIFSTVWAVFLLTFASVYLAEDIPTVSGCVVLIAVGVIMLVIACASTCLTLNTSAFEEFSAEAGQSPWI